MAYYIYFVIKTQKSVRLKTGVHKLSLTYCGIATLLTVTKQIKRALFKLSIDLEKMYLH